MVDLSDKKSCGSYGISSSSPTEIQEMKRCADCGTSKTPLWRSGPAGPKTLCNACGIRSRKKRRVFLGLKSDDNKKISKKSNSNNSTTTTTTTTTTNCNSSSTSRLSGSPLHQRLLAIGREVMMQRSTVENHSRKMINLGEDEQAAVLLMALSYGSVYA